MQLCIVHGLSFEDFERQFEQIFLSIHIGDCQHASLFKAFV